jgi:hypothetical protein
VRRCVAAVLALLLSPAARADDFELHGYADLRLVAAPDEKSWTDGGLGKARFGDGDPVLQFGGGALLASWQIAPAWLAQATVQAQTTDRSTLDLVDAFVRWRPVSTSRWRFSIRAGEFFAPISLENDGIGWTSRYTLSSSAINAWVGEELRTFGAELRAERRGGRATIEGAVAVFGANDPAGELLAARGWSISDLHYGYGSDVREPDALGGLIGAAPPLRYDPYVETDHRLGWYAQLEARAPALGRVSILRYDNRGDPTTEVEHGAGHEVYTWKTAFTALGAQTRVADVTLLAQAISGNTGIVPSPFFRTNTRFHAGYLLAGWERGDWRPAVRVDLFQASQGPAAIHGVGNEHGNAVTLALNWRPQPWLRVTGELLRIDSARTERRLVGLDERQTDKQFQLSARVLW